MENAITEEKELTRVRARADVQPYWTEVGAGIVGAAFSSECPKLGKGGTRKTAPLIKQRGLHKQDMGSQKPVVPFLKASLPHKEAVSPRGDILAVTQARK